MSGVFRLRDRVLEAAYQALEARGLRFAHRPPGFEAMLEAFYRRLALGGRVAIDVGAHVGRHTLPLSRQVGNNGRVHAFEPLESARHTLERRLRAAGRRNVVVHADAVADRAGTSTFHAVVGFPEESALRPRPRHADARSEVQQVTTVRLDDVVPGADVAFLKIDVEGGELDVLRGARGTLARCMPAIAFECGAEGYGDSRRVPREIFDLLASHGYSLHAITGEAMADAGTFEQATNAQRSWDYLALPHSHDGALVRGLREAAKARPIRQRG